jgi:2-dehydro-3-deoxyphosphogluconate aldolase/(4S)-4-hydroxy-2-oxoglutarate aldolase
MERRDGAGVLGDLDAALRRIGVVPVVALVRATDATPLAEALLEGGLPCVEITFRTEAAAAAIHAVRSRFPDMIVGAGTLLTTAHVDAAIDAGAMFAVTPGFNPTVVDYCISRGMPIAPGVATPSEIEQALARGIGLVKLFPAGAMGGVGYLKAIAGPYPMIRFLPTGGITAENLADYLALGTVAACGGTWLCKPELLDRGDFTAIRQLALEAAAIVRRVREAQAAAAAAPAAAATS